MTTDPLVALALALPPLSPTVDATLPHHCTTNDDETSRPWPAATLGTQLPPPRHHHDNDTRLARSRERNREHARRTRLRKKVQLERLQAQVQTLRGERHDLRQRMEDCSLAAILWGLGGRDRHQRTRQLLMETNKPTSTTVTDVASAATSTTATATTATTASAVDTESDETTFVWLAGSKRKRFVAEDGAETHTQLDLDETPPSLTTESLSTERTTGKTQINWKTGVQTDQYGSQTQLTPYQLESLRRERNRRHAKMTRDRKKCFVVTTEKVVADLQAENARLRQILAQVTTESTSHLHERNHNHSTANTLVTPVTSPDLSAIPSPTDDETSVYSATTADDGSILPRSPQRNHTPRAAFSLNDD
jgi:hypothetical protein